jgi:hypothetical protein
MGGEREGHSGSWRFVWDSAEPPSGWAWSSMMTPA